MIIINEQGRIYKWNKKRFITNILNILGIALFIAMAFYVSNMEFEALAMVVK